MPFLIRALAFLVSLIPVGIATLGIYTLARRKMKSNEQVQRTGITEQNLPILKQVRPGRSASRPLM